MFKKLFKRFQKQKAQGMNLLARSFAEPFSERSLYTNWQRRIATTLVVSLMVQLLQIPIINSAPAVFADSGSSLTIAQQADTGTNTPAENHVGIVAVLVENSLLDDTTSYPGLTASYSSDLTYQSLKDRINRYAADVQSSQQFTKSLIIKVNKTDKVEQVAAALEKLYQEGDGTPNEITKLVGIVIVGDVPLPVVNKKGNHFVSLFPYTNFEDKVYIYNATTGEYELNPDLQFPKSDIWSGVIKPPEADDTAGDQGRTDLATYFDKNHLYHIGNSDFAKFDKKLLISDLYNEFKGMNTTSFQSYIRWLAHWDDFAYLRYTKGLAQEFYNEVQSQLQDQGLSSSQLSPSSNCDKSCIIAKNDRSANPPLDSDGDGYSNCYELFVGSKQADGTNKPTDPNNPDDIPLDFTASPPVPRTDPDPATYQCPPDDGTKLDIPNPPASNPSDSFKTLPDVQSKVIIQNFVDKYVQLFDKYLGIVNDWTDGTGRYQSAYVDGSGKHLSDLHSLPSLISIKDDYTLQYMRMVNFAVEHKIDDIIEGSAGFVGTTFNAVPEGAQQNFLFNLATGSTASLAPGVFLHVSDNGGGSGNMKVTSVINAQQFTVDQVVGPITKGAEVSIVNPSQKLYGQIPMILGTSLTGTICETSGLPYVCVSPADQFEADFINSSQTNFGGWTALMMNGSIISDIAAGLPSNIANLFVPATNVASCLLYRGSDDGALNPDGSKKNTSLVQAVRTLDPKSGGDPSKNTQYAECYGNNYLHPDRCFPSAATGPVFDITGAQKVNPATVAYFDDYRSCFDFKEKNQFQNYLTAVSTYMSQLDSAKDEHDKSALSKPDPASQYQSPDNISLYSDILTGVKLNFGDILRNFHLVGPSDIPTDNWQAIGQLLLEKNQTYTFPTNPNLDPSGNIKSLTITVTPFPAKDPSGNPVSLDAIIYHKDPTNQAISDQLKAGGFTQSLPVDNPRYVTLWDKSSNQTQQKIVYPDIFKATSYDDFKNQLQAEEAQLQSIATASGVSVNVAGQLTGIINGNSDVFTNQDQTALFNAAAPDLQDAFTWENMNIDEKHVYAISHYLGQNQNPYIEKQSNGYETAYIVSQPVINPDDNKTSDAFYVRFNGNYPQSEPDIDFQTGQNPPPTPKTQPGGGTGGGGGSSSASAADDGELFPAPWFPDIIQWVKDTVSKLTATVTLQPACAVSSQSLGEVLGNTNAGNGNNTNNSGVTTPPSGPDNTAKLRVSASKNSLKTAAADTLTITIDGISNSGALQTGDNLTMVDLNIQKLNGNDIAIPISTHPIQLYGGTANITLESTKDSGVFTVSALSPNKSWLPSNSVSITSTAGYIRLLTYTKTADLGLNQVSAGGLVVKDNNGNIIADVDPLTGMATIVDDKYQLVSLPSNATKPARLVVQEKSTGKIWASIFFVADKTKPVTVDDRSTDYSANYKTLPEVHVQDLDDTGVYTIEKISPSDPVNPNGVYLYSNQGSTKNKIGMVNTLGNIFADSSYGFQIEPPTSPSGPVIFQITDSSGKAIFNIYIGAKFPKIQVLAPTGDYQDFNLVAYVKEASQMTAMLGKKLLAYFSNDSHAQGMDQSTQTTQTTPDQTQTTQQTMPPAPALTDAEEIMLRGALVNPSSFDKAGDYNTLMKGLDPTKTGQAPLFTDINPGTTGWSDIIKLYIHGILRGYSDGTFRPNDPITREEFTKIDLGSICVLCQQFSQSRKKSVDTVYQLSPFPDQNITPSLLYCVEESKNRNIVSGYQGGPSAGYFVPQSNISVAEATKVLLETARQQNDTTITFDNYPLDGKPWYYNYVLTAQNAKLFPTGLFNQLDNLNPQDFKVWFDLELTNPASNFIYFLSNDITRGQFAIMTSQLLVKGDCYSFQNISVSSISPNSGLVTGGTAVTIKGSNFSPKAAVTFGGVPATGVTVVNSTTIQAVTPGQSNPGAVDVVVSNPGLGTSTIKNGFTYYLPPCSPTITSVTPNAGPMPGGTLITLTGTCFNSQTGVQLQGEGVALPADATNITVVNSTTITALTPPSPFPGNATVTVSNPGAGSANGGFTYTDGFGGSTGFSKEKEGGYIVGDTISDSLIYAPPQSATTAGSENLNFIDTMPADGQSQLILRAEILDANGDTDTSFDSNAIQFKAAPDNTGAYAVINPTSVQIKNGTAETIIQSTTTAGQYNITAEIAGAAIPSDEHTVDVTPLDPAKIVLTADSQTLKSGGLSNTTVHALLEDTNGNLENGDSYKLNFTIDGPGTLDASKNEDASQPGVTMSSVTGQYDIGLTSTADPGTITIHAKYVPDTGILTSGDTQQDTQQTSTNTVSSDLAVNSRNDLKLVLSTESSTVPSDNTTSDALNASVVDTHNNLVSDFNGTVKFSLENSTLGQMVGAAQPDMTNGLGKGVFEASNLAGTETVTATVGGFDPATATIQVLPKASKKIILESSRQTIESNTSSTADIVAKLYDTDDNFASNDSSTMVTFKLTDDTKAYGTFDGSTTVQAQNGEAHITLRGTSQSGPINIVATGSNLVTASTSVQAIKLFRSTDVKSMSPNALFTALLGSDYGNIFDDNYMGGEFVFNGKTESALSLLSAPKPNLQLANVRANGALDIFDSSQVDTRIIPGNNSTTPNRIILTNPDTSEDLAEVFTVFKPQSKAQILSQGQQVSDTQEGMYVQNTSSTTDYTLQQASDGIAILKDGNEAVHIYDSGSIKVVDNNFQLQAISDPAQKYLTINVVDGSQNVAQITAVTNFSNDASFLDTSYTFGNSASLQSGTYFHMLTTKQMYSNLKTFSGNSSADPRGYALIDTTQDMPKSEAPGFTYTSLESSLTSPGIGFQGDSKFMLLFAAGNSVGESSMPYSSEIGVVLGDPTVRLDNKVNVSATGYTKDVGQEIFSGVDPIQEVTPIDYNGDGLTDLLVEYKDGRVRLLENTRGYPRYIDKGIFLDFPNGIISMATGDFNHDGQQDLVVATQDSCRQGEVCVNEYENHHGNFVEKYLALQPFSDKNRITMIRTADVNNDGYDDIITADDSGAIRVFYNNNGQIDTNGQFVGSLGLHIDSTANLKEEVLVSYDGMPQKDPAHPENDQYFVDVPVTKSQADLTDADKQNLGISGDASPLLSPDEASAIDALKNSDPSGVTTPPADAQVDEPFVYLDASPDLITSEKRAKNLTETTNVLALGDTVQYTLKFTNNASHDLTNFMFADVFPSSMTIDKSTFQCSDCGSQQLQFEDTGESMRPYVVSGITIPAGQTRTITYSGSVNATPRIKIVAGKNLTKDLAANNYPMIGAAPDRNTSGLMTFYYEQSVDPLTNHINWNTYTTPPPPPPTPIAPTDPTIGSSFPLTNSSFASTSGSGIPDNVQNYENNLATPDSSGLPSAWDNFNNSLNGVADAAQAIVSFLSCSQGCIPMPINFAFLAPGAINVLGIPSGFDPGLPIFAWGVPSLIPIWPPMPYQASLGGRIYLSPTLTASLGIGVCLGPYLAGVCWAFKLPIDLIPSGICSAIQNGINSAMAGANNFISSAGSTGVIESGQTSDSTGRNATGGMTGSTSLGNYSYSAGVSTNFRIPSFPAVITKWIEDQTNEIVNKLSKLPDFYFIYPDPTSIIGAVVPQQGALQSGSSGQNSAFTFPTFSSAPLALATGGSAFKAVLSTPSKFLRFLNNIPLIQIVSQEVAIKIPALSPMEIAKIKADAQQWVEDERIEVNRALTVWSCGFMQLDQNWSVQKSGGPGTSQYQTLCEKLIVNMTKLKQSVEKNIDAIQKYLELPRKILAWKNIAAKYLYQIICYLDTIMQFAGGYIKKQTSRVILWINMIKQIRQLLMTWKLLIDLIVNYQASCDRCSSSRLTLLELILKLFAVIPSPPIIPFPKLPDIYLDVSQIQIGLKIVWPDIKFTPVPLLLPKIPRITLPDAPTITLNLPAIPIIPDPPDLPELPDLPPLPVPQLPDIPPPPKIPGLPSQIQIVLNILKTIIQIICLIRKGLIPIPELNLKSQIEQLTERPLTPLIPLDLLLKLQFPAIKYAYVDHIQIKTILNFQLDFSPIYTFVKGIADAWNGLATDLIEKANKALQDASKAAEAVTSAPSQAGGGNINIGKSSALMEFLAKAVNQPEAALNQIETDPNSVANMLADNSQTLSDIGSLDVNKVSDKDAQGMLKDLEKNDPMLGHYLSLYQQASQGLTATANQYRQNNQTIQKDIHLKATEKYLTKNDPVLNQSISQIKARISLESPPDTDMGKRVAALRDALIAYTDQGTKITDMLGNSNDLAQTVALLAQSKSLSDYLPKDDASASNSVYYASAGSTDNTSDKTNPAVAIASLADETFQTFVDNMKSDLDSQIPLLADTGNLPDVPQTPGSSGMTAQPKGIYIMNPDKGINERLINYTAEADAPTQLLFVDVYNKSTQDAIYSSGTNIYMKENYNSLPQYQCWPQDPTIVNACYIGDNPDIKNLSDIVPPAPAVNGFVSTYQNNKLVDMKWKAPTEGAVSGYQIIYKLVPDSFSQNVSPITHKVATIIAAVLQPTNATVTVNKGSYKLNGQDPQDSQAPADAAITTQDGSEVILDYGTMGKVTIPADVTVKASAISQSYMTAQNVNGDLYFDGSQRTVVTSGASGNATGGETLHTLDAATFSISDQGTVQANYDLPANTTFTFASDIKDTLNINVNSGDIEIINPQTIVQHQKVVNGIMFDFDTQIYSQGGDMRINIGDGSYLRIYNGEDMLLKKLDTPDQPSINFQIPNGFYYARIQSFDHAGDLSTLSALQLMAPSICADKEPPVPNGGPADRTAYIFKALTLDASKSFDTNGSIISYSIQTDSNIMCGNKTLPLSTSDNDLLSQDCSNPSFTMGPYKDLKDRHVTLKVFNEAHIPSTQDITIHVVVPGIQLSQDIATSGVADGNLDVPVSQIPVALLRDRGGVLTQIKTPAADSNGKYFTDDQGKFSVNDLNLQDTIVIRNSSGEIIAEINPQTGRIILKDPNYEIDVLTAEGLLPTRVVVKQKSDGQIITALFLVPDVNTDTTIDDATVPYDKNTVTAFQGVHIKDDNGYDNFVFQKIPANDPSYPGGTEIIDSTSKQREAVIDTGGNFYNYDDRLSLALKDASDLNDPLVIQILFTKDSSTPPVVLGEFVIAVHSKKGVQILPSDKFKSYTAPNQVLPQPQKIPVIAPVPIPQAPPTPFQDVSPNTANYQDIVNLFQRHVLDDLMNFSNSGTNFGPDIQLKRSEFADIMLKIFCIVPRPEAYQSPEAFTDIPFIQGNLPWYYAVTKEAYFQGFITGYQGEIDPSTGKTPFKPEASISRAEAVKIILEALQRKGVIDMGNVPVVAPYYAPYMQIAQDLTPYLKQKSLVNEPYIITADEATKPNEALTRAEFIAMADRVLKAYDCYTGGSAAITTITPNVGPTSGGTAVTISGVNFSPKTVVTFNGTAATNVQVQNSTTIQAVTPAQGNPGPADVDITNPDSPSAILKNGFTYQGCSPVVTSVTPNSGPMPGGTVITIKGSCFTNDTAVQLQAKGDTIPADATRVVVLNSTTIVAVTPPHLQPGPVDLILTNPNFPGTTYPDGFNYQNPPELGDPRKNLVPGIYVIQPECNTCPCLSTIDHTADIVPDDQVFAVISNDDNSQIFSKSNVVQVTDVPQTSAGAGTSTQETTQQGS